MNKSIFTLEQEYYDILAQVEELDGELTPELEEALNINAENVETKLASIKYFIKMSQSNDQRYKDEIEKINERRTVNANFERRLRDLAIKAVQVFGTPNRSGNAQYKTSDFNMYVVNRDKSVIEESYLDNINLYVDPITNQDDADNYEMDELLKAALVDLRVKIKPSELHDLYNILIEKNMIIDTDDNIKYELKFNNKALSVINEYVKSEHVKTITTPSITIR